jgi:putative nucleotidyltransferase with HDIG domain
MESNIRDDKNLEKFAVNIPPFPRAAQQVMGMLRDPRVQIPKVADIVALDQGFATKVLRMANSAYFGLPRKVSNVTEALVLLGWANVRIVLISASVGPILCRGLKSYNMEEGVLWEHSVGSAFATQMLSKDLAPAIYNMAFTSGLLHDVGKVATDMQLRGELRKQFADIASTSGPEVAEKEVVGYTHSEIGEYLCTRWNLPEEIAEAIRFHHEPSSSESKLPGAVAAADVLSNILLKEGREVTVSDFERAPQGTFVPKADMLARVMEELPTVIASSRELLGGTSEVVTVGADSEEK